MNGEAIEKRLFDLAMSFNDAHLHVDGGVYYRELRPMRKNSSSYKEDIIVAFKTGNGEDIQSGTCLLNVYIPDIQANSGMFYKNKERCIEVANILEQFHKFANENADIYFKQDGMIYTIAEESIKQHFVSLQMNFKVLNENY